MQPGDRVHINYPGLWCDKKTVTVKSIIEEAGVECFAFEYTWSDGQTIGYALPISCAWVLKDQRECA